MDKRKLAVIPISCVREPRTCEIKIQVRDLEIFIFVGLIWPAINERLVHFQLFYSRYNKLVFSVLSVEINCEFKRPFPVCSLL